MGIEKRIQIDDNRILIFSITEGYAKPTYTITEGFLENGDVKKSYSLSQWDDYGLNAWINNDEDVSQVSFEFDMNHPLFVPLLHLLNYDEELIIDDDDTREENKKYLSIKRDSDRIVINFIDTLDLDYSTFSERFHVFIKNIFSDGRSKIDQNYKDTKRRLYVFFNEAMESIMKEYHQMNMEEYLIKDFPKEECNELIKAFRRDYN